MSQKLALVVDDSQSAQQVLRRMLEKHDISVDTTSSASEALDYLSRHRPDVIFMDHNMPGMDGFEAIKQIKANPETVTIPVMMYTSKEGDLYLGEARALGAVGILPKTVAPAELFSALVRLGLTQDRRDHDSSNENPDEPSERAGDVANVGARGWAIIDDAIPVRTHESISKEDDRMRFLLDEQRTEFRKDMLIAIDSVSKNINNRHSQEIENLFSQLQDSRPVDDSTKWLKLAAIASGFLLLWTLSGIHHLKNQIADLTSPITDSPRVTGKTDLRQSAAQRKKPTQPSITAKKKTAGPDKQKTSHVQTKTEKHLSYPFDELALEKDRILDIGALVDQLKTEKFKGAVTLETHVGDFCLTGNTTQGFLLADSKLPVTDCDYIGNPVQPTDLPAAQQSLQFANFLSSLNLDDDFTIDIVSLPRTTPLVDYPERGPGTQAGNWNRAAAINNQVKIRLQTE
ncbi:MAG: response regulator [Gammaproteobacteria bacterium]